MTESSSAAGRPVRSPFERCAQRLAGLGVWRGAAASAGFGVLAAGALPPLYLLPLLWLAFPGLLWLLDGAGRWSRAFLLGWTFALGYFGAGLYWVGHAFLVDAEQFGVIMPFAVAGLAGGLALFHAGAVVAVWLSGSRGLTRVVLLAMAWVVAEWLRSWVFTGFPWNPLGTVWAFSSVPLQLAAVTGVWGLSLVTVLAAAAPACLVGVGRPARQRWAPLALVLGLPVLLFAFGALRLAGAPALGADAVEGLRLRIVQPSIDQKTKWQADLRAAHVAGQMAMSTQNAGAPVTHVIWAETAIPFLLPDTARIRDAVSQAVPPGGLILSGALRRDTTDGDSRLWNSLFAIDDQGEIVAAYDKRHLVPFGEYVPLRGVIPFEKLVQGRGDFAAGEGPRLLSLPGLPPVSALICYEAIFPGRVVDRGAEPSWLLNITNDAWFGTSTGPYQHFASARLRAVEEGLPLVRAANSGISAVVDAYGRVVDRLGLNRVGVIDASLPRPTEDKTIFGRFGNWTLLILMCGTFSLLFAIRRFH